MRTPWSTVLPLAAVMAYADGFWVITAQGAVGTIERAQSPTVSWALESTLALPVFVLAVLWAVVVARAWFGTVPAGTGMAGMPGMEHGTATCDGRCDALRRTATVDVRAIEYGAGAILVTNLALVGWVMALRGGRVEVMRRNRSQPALSQPAQAQPSRATI